MGRKWIEASVRMASDALTAEQIEEQVALKATRKVNRGDPVSRRSPTSGSHQRAFCSYDCPIGSERHPDEHIAWLIQFLKDAKDALELLGSQCDVDVRIGFSSSSGQGGLAFGSDELLVLAEVGAHLSLDLFTFDGDEGEEE